MDRRHFNLSLLGLLAGCGGEMEYQLQQSPVLRTGKNVFPGGIEQAWTPTFTFTTPGNLSVSYGIRDARAIRFGSLVIAIFSMRITPTHTTAAGDARIDGIPWTAAAINNGCASPLFTSDVNYLLGTAAFTRTLPNSRQLRLITTGDNITATDLDITSFTSGAAVDLIGNVIYLTSDFS